MEQDTFFRDVERYLSFSNIDEQKINELNKIINDNSWIDYYSQCDAEIDGWIDFEREIYPVIELFEKIMSSNYEITGNGNSFGNAHINKDDLTPLGSYFKKSSARLCRGFCLYHHIHATL